MSTDYVVERIDSKKIISGTTYYFIKWKGWPETSNTWEPFENLDGCQKLLKEFEKREAKSAASRERVRKRTVDQDDKEDVDKALAETAAHMKSYGILPSWPADKEPLSVEGVILVEGQLTYIVKRKSKQRSTGLTRSNAILVYAERFRLQYPHLVIKYYENRVLWTDNAKLEEEQANAASQSTLLNRNIGSRRGKIIANDIDCKLREMHGERKEVNKQVKLEANDYTSSSEDQGIEDDEAMEEEEVQDIDDKSNDEDNFGLPNNLDHISSDDDLTSGSESELEEIDVEIKQEGWDRKRSTQRSNQVTSDEDDSWNWKRSNKSANSFNSNDNDDGGMNDY